MKKRIKLKEINIDLILYSLYSFYFCVFCCLYLFVYASNITYIGGLLVIIFFDYACHF